MKQVAKLIIINNEGKHLLLRRNNHPRFGNDPDIPGGTLEEGESPLETMIREVYEEAGITVDQKNVREVYAGTDYSQHGTHYSLYITTLPTTPQIIISWEHSSHEWLGHEAFLKQVQSANDSYMRMVYHKLSELST